MRAPANSERLESWPLNRLRILCRATYLSGIVGLGPRDVTLGFRTDLRHSRELAIDTLSRLTGHTVSASPSALRAQVVEEGTSAIALGIIARERSNFPRLERFFLIATLPLAAIGWARLEANSVNPPRWRFWEPRWSTFLRINRLSAPDVVLGWRGRGEELQSLQDELDWLSLGPRDLSRLTPAEFEGFVVQQFERIGAGVGASVRATGGGGDGGVDAVVYHAGTRIAVQCKHQSRPVGPDAVRDLVGAVSVTGSAFGILVASSGFSHAARVTAREGRIRLIHASALHKCTPEQLERPTA